MKRLPALLTIFLLLLTSLVARAQSALDGFDPNANGIVFVVVVQPDGKILLGGDFTTLSPNGGPAITRNRLARLNPDGTVDATFDPNSNGRVNSIVVQTDGNILVGGGFTSIGGQTRNNIARLDSATGLADSFDPDANSLVLSIVMQADGKILAAGTFNHIGGQVRNHIARLDPLTGLADSFHPNANGDVYALAVQTDGKILAGGIFQGPSGMGGQTRNYIARLDGVTGLPDSFDPNATGHVYSLALQPDGKILAGGVFPSIGGQTRHGLARLDPTTGQADSFNPNANDTVVSIALQADGKILVAGFFHGANSMGGQERNGIARLDPITGAADAFDPNAGGNSLSFAVAVQPDGKILFGGNFTTIAPNGGASVPRNHIARLEADGRLDQTLDLDIAVGGMVFATAVQPDGKVLIGGQFQHVLGVAINNLARLNTDGSLDIDFMPEPNGAVTSIVVQKDGKILVGGPFTGFGPVGGGGPARNRIARLDPQGQPDSFNPNSNGVVVAIIVQPDGKILVSGGFSGTNSIGGQTRNYVARLDPGTGLADSFDPNPNSFVYSIATQADGKILAGGNFTTIGGQARKYMARLDAATGTADDFDPNADSAVNSIAVQPDGKILTGGAFTAIGGQTRRFVARLDAATGLADSFNPDADNEVYSIALQADGKVLVGGKFLTVGGQARYRIARLTAVMGAVDLFNPRSDSTVWSLALHADGKSAVGGDVSPRYAFARVSNDTAALQNLNIAPESVTWVRGGSSPQFGRVTFESSTDNANYAPLGDGIAAGSNWTLSGLNLPTGQNLYVRARGYYRGGEYNGSESITESVRNAFLPGPAGTPAPTPTATPSPTATSTPTPTAPPTATATPVPTATPGATPTPAATPTPVATSTPTPTATSTPALTPTPSPTPTATPGSLGNISTRVRVLSGDNALIGGLIATGTASKKVLIRAVGPTLADFGVADALQDPTLELYQGSTLLASNDNWRQSSQQVEIQNSGLAPNKDGESAIIATLTPNQNYTAIVRGKNGMTGVGSVEAFDLEPEAASKLGNISTRGFVDVDDNVMIAGLIAGPGNGTSLNILVRALGPALGNFGVAGVLADPTLDLVNSSGTVIRSNHDWKDDAQQRALIEAAGLAPNHDEEAALVETIAPGAYTAIVRGNNRTTGVGLVEVYNIP